MSKATQPTFNYDGQPYRIVQIEQAPSQSVNIGFKVLKENNEPAEPVYIWSEPEHCDCEAGNHETERETNQETARLCEPLHKDR